MTIIVYNTEGVAVDRRCTEGYQTVEVTKWFPFKEGILLGTGDWTLIQAAIADLKADKPHTVSHLYSLFYYRFAKDGLPAVMYEVRDGVFPESLYDWGLEYASFGSGQSHALLGLRSGRTLIESIALATRYDTGCGHGIDMFTPTGDHKEFLC